VTRTRLKRCCAIGDSAARYLNAATHAGLVRAAEPPTERRSGTSSATACSIASSQITPGIRADLVYRSVNAAAHQKGFGSAIQVLVDGRGLRHSKDASFGPARSDVEPLPVM